MKLLVIIKQPGEVLRREVRFAGLAGAASVEDVRVEARGSGLASALAASAAVVGGAVIAAISGGDDGEQYLITVQASDLAGAVAESSLEVAVIDPAWAMPDGGAPYLSIAEFVDRVGLAETIAATDGVGDGRIDRAMIIARLTGAQTRVEAYLGARYSLPIDPLPPIVKELVGDLAHAALYPAGAPDGVAEAARQAVRMLERIQSGAMPLPAATPPKEGPSPTPVLIAPGRRVYPDGLAGYADRLR